MLKSQSDIWKAFTLLVQKLTSEGIYGEEVKATSEYRYLRFLLNIYRRAESYAAQNLPHLVGVGIISFQEHRLIHAQRLAARMLAKS